MGRRRLRCSGRQAPAKATRPNQVLAIVCVGIVLANLDLFIVNVALPNITGDFRDAGLEKLSWILNGYAIVSAALLVFFGRLVESFRRNASFLLGVAVFTIAWRRAPQPPVSKCSSRSVSRKRPAQH